MRKKIYEIINGLMSEYFFIGDKTHGKIDSFKDLTDGWHFGEGRPATMKSIEIAKKLNMFARLIGLDTDAVPGLEGEVGFIVYSAEQPINHHIEFIIINESHIEATWFKKDGEHWIDVNDIDNMNIIEAVKAINKFKRELDRWQSISGYFGKNIISQNSVDSAAWHLETMKGEYRSSTGSVSMNPIIAYAST